METDGDDEKPRLGALGWGRGSEGVIEGERATPIAGTVVLLGACDGAAVD